MTYRITTESILFHCVTLFFKCIWSHEVCGSYLFKYLMYLQSNPLRSLLLEYSRNIYQKKICISFVFCITPRNDELLNSKEHKFFYPTFVSLSLDIYFLRSYINIRVSLCHHFSRQGHHFRLSPPFTRKEAFEIINSLHLLTDIFN